MGGAERQGLHLARWLQMNHGADIEVWGLNHPGSATLWCDRHNIPWRLVPWKWSRGGMSGLIGMLRLLLELRRAKPAVLLPYTMPPNIVCGLFWRMAGAKTCIWNQRDEGRHRCFPWLEQFAVRNTPWLVSNSSHGVDFLVEELGARRERVEVIHNGVDLAPAANDKSAWREQFKVPHASLVACMIANLHQFKDHATLLRAWRLVLEESDGPLPVLFLAGHDYGSGHELKALADQLGIANQLRFPGHVDDISGLLYASDIGVFSSRKEGVPNGVLECMAAGLPVVATDIPGIREALGVDNHRFLAAPGDPLSMSRALLQLLHDHALRQAVGLKNLKRVRSEFSKEQMCERYSQVIVRSLNSHHINRLETE
jgi:glycosyltransferase involved in cell wall biosynthesis